MNKTEKQFTLCIETGISGGSLCVFKGLEKIALWEGSSEVSKSEDILPAIVEIFDTNSIEKQTVSSIIVSTNPGSVTGIRIGRSIAIGLRNAFESNIEEVGLFEKLFCLVESKIIDNVLAIVPIGQNRFVWSLSDDWEKATINNVCEIDKIVWENDIGTIIAHQNIADIITLDRDVKIIDAGSNMAQYLFISKCV